MHVEDMKQWKLYIHLTTDSDWSTSSYKVVDTQNTMDQVIGVFNHMPQSFVEKSMLFFMKENIKPIWEDERNRKGGCFSFKVENFRNMSIQEVYKRACYGIVTNTFCNDTQFMENVNGITISPKKNFHILKLWMKNKEYKTLDGIEMDENIIGLHKDDCIFKEHQPEF